jgi:hypothetical protein
MTKDPNLDRKLIRKKPTIEHIMPKKLGKWYDDIRLDSNYKDRSNQAIDDDYGMYGNRLGNLLILDSEKIQSYQIILLEIKRYNIKRAQCFSGIWILIRSQQNFAIRLWKLNIWTYQCEI